MTATTFNTYQVWEFLLGSPHLLSIILQLQTSNHLLYKPKFAKILAHVHPVCMICLSINSYLDDTAYKLSWSKLSDFRVKTFLKLIIQYKITSQTNAWSYLHRNRPQKALFLSKNIIQTSKKNPLIMEKVEAVFLLHEIMKTCVESLKKLLFSFLKLVLLPSYARTQYVYI